MERSGPQNRRSGDVNRRRGNKKKKHSWQAQEAVEKDIEVGICYCTNIEIANGPYIKTGLASGYRRTELVEFFMTDSASADWPSYSRDLVKEFCLGDITQQSEHGVCPQYEENVDALYQLMEGFRDIPAAQVALIDYWSHCGKEEPTFRHSGPLNPQEIRSMLEQISEHATKVKKDMINQIARRDRKSHPQHSSRLVIFITNLSKWSLAAIISTPTINQARGLRKSLYRHLDFQSYIGEIPPAYRYPNYVFAFDLPYYAFRSFPHDKKPKDDRKKKGGQLREVTPLRYLSRSTDVSDPPKNVDYICEAQISLLVTGADESDWTAYFFMDTYFEPDDEAESAEKYEEDRKNNAGDMHTDPLTGGQSDVSATKLTAREYFLIVFELRLKQYMCEWETLVTSMQTKIQAYVNECPVTALDISYSPSSQDMSSVGIFYKSIIQTRKHLDEMAHKLNSTLRQWNEWRSTRPFAKAPKRAAHLLPEIESCFSELKRLSEDLGYSQAMCKDYEAKLAFYANFDGTMNAKAQGRKNDKALAKSLIIVAATAPVTLAAAIMSMQTPAIPSFLGVNSKSFFALISVFGCFIWIPMVLFSVSEHLPSIEWNPLVLLKQEHMREEERAAQRPRFSPCQSLMNIFSTRQYEQRGVPQPGQ